jgi:hypothetical protein
MAILRDLIVVIPGIMGSELRNEHGVIWGTSWNVLWGLLKSGGFQTLTLDYAKDVPDRDVLDDHVEAERVVPCAHMIPGFWKIDFYSHCLARIQSAFSNVFHGVATRKAVQAGRVYGKNSSGEGNLANLLEFPYDWRRDNRVAALRLKNLIEHQVQAFAKEKGSRPKVILVAHSMGGLISRHYLEVEGGWEYCRGLISFGTPYGGSPQAANYLVNGYAYLSSILRPVLATFTSVYQLLPVYPVIRSGEGQAYKRIHEVSGLSGVDQTRAVDAWQFHDTMRQRASATKPAGCFLIPFVGVDQPTMQSFTWDGGAGFAPSDEVPPAPGGSVADAALFPAGDGTVPRASATPFELTGKSAEHFVVEQHSSLLTNGAMLDNLITRLQESQVSNSKPFWDVPGQGEKTTAGPSLSLDLRDSYDRSEPVTFELRVLGGSPENPPEVTVRQDENGRDVATTVVAEADGRWVVNLSGLQPIDLYRVEASARVANDRRTIKVHDIFVVGDPKTGGA